MSFVNDKNYKEYSQRQVITETLEPLNYFGLWEIKDGECPSTDKIISCLKKVKPYLAKAAKSGKVFTKVWLEIEEVEVDEYGHTEHRLVVKGNRLETDKEYKSRLEAIFFHRILDKNHYEFSVKYWETKEGQEEWAAIVKSGVVKEHANKTKNGKN